jgi:hypothetical protein
MLRERGKQSPVRECLSLDLKLVTLIEKKRKYGFFNLCTSGGTALV